jgi:hypothetical protein
MTSCQYKQSTEQYALFKNEVQEFFSEINTFSFIEFIPNFTNALYKRICKETSTVWAGWNLKTVFSYIAYNCTNGIIRSLHRLRNTHLCSSQKWWRCQDILFSKNYNFFLLYCVLWVTFSIPSGSSSPVKYSVL